MARRMLQEKVGERGREKSSPGRDSVCVNGYKDRTRVSLNCVTHSHKISQRKTKR